MPVSVTVSIGELTSGVRRTISRVRWPLKSTWRKQAKQKIRLHAVRNRGKNVPTPFVDCCVLYLVRPEVNMTRVENQVIVGVAEALPEQPGCWEACNIEKGQFTHSLSACQQKAPVQEFLPSSGSAEKPSAEVIVEAIVSRRQEVAILKQQQNQALPTTRGLLPTRQSGRPACAWHVRHKSLACSACSTGFELKSLLPVLGELFSIRKSELTIVQGFDKLTLGLASLSCLDDTRPRQRLVSTASIAPFTGSTSQPAGPYCAWKGSLETF